MINIDIDICLTSDDASRFRSIRAGGRQLTKNKCFEYEVYKSTTLFGFTLSITTKKDHAGLDIGASLLGYTARACIYDARHWDEENNKWIEYDQEI